MPARSFALAALLVVLGLSWQAAVAQDDQPTVPVASETTAEPAAPVAPAHPDAAERRERRDRAVRALGDNGLLLVLAEGRASGFTGKRRSDEFRYLSPFVARDAALLVYLDGDSVQHRIYLTPRNPAFERWNGPTVGPGEETAAQYEFEEARALQALPRDVADLLADRRSLHVSATSPADGADRLDALLAKVQPLLTEGLALERLDRRGAPAIAEGGSGPAPEMIRSVRSASAAITSLRAVKSASEIEHVRRAVEATVTGINDALRTARPGLAEYQIQSLVELRCQLDGCHEQAFDSIIGSGPNSCILHYSANDRIMQDGDIVVMDVGGEFDGYAADVTRTFPVSGKFTDEQARVYDAVLAAQEAALAAVRPGVTLRDVHAAAKAVLVEAELNQYFLHGTSHSVGLNVHDPFGRQRKLEVGSILTVEPGAYIAEQALGVRIEDTVVVTEDGCTILSAGAPKTREAIEALMAEDAPIEIAPPR